MGNNRIHVIPQGDQWKAMREGAKQASAVGSTQADMERRAKEILANSGGGEVVIHNRQGLIHDTDTVPPANDPCPPKDQKH